MSSQQFREFDYIDLIGEGQKGRDKQNKQPKASQTSQREQTEQTLEPQPAAVNSSHPPAINSLYGTFYPLHIFLSYCKIQTSKVIRGWKPIARASFKLVICSRQCSIHRISEPRKLNPHHCRYSSSSFSQLEFTPHSTTITTPSLAITLRGERSILANMEDHHLDDESRRKRVKLSTDDQATAAQEIAEAVVEATTITTATAADDAQALKEAEVGITEFVCPDVPGFSGILKKR